MHIAYARYISVSSVTHEGATRVQNAPNGIAVGQPDPGTKKLTFEDLGVHPPIVASLREAFPSIQNPTEMQAKLIPAVLEGKDVLLKDKTGSGK